MEQNYLFESVVPTFFILLHAVNIGVGTTDCVINNRIIAFWNK